MFKTLIFCILIGTTIKASCPGGSYEWQTSCFFFQNESTGFAEAESNCADLFVGHLVSIHDGFTNTLLAQKGQLYFNRSTVTDFWIGLTSLILPGNWTWVDETILDFSEWIPGELQNATGNCVSLSVSDGRWKINDCFKTKPYVCRVEKNGFELSTPATLYNTTNYHPNCNLGFIYYEPTHSCYGSGQWGIADWAQGEDRCKYVGGHLVSFHSYEELYFIQSLQYPLSDLVWSGAYSNDEGQTWKWSDGTPWDYSPWMSGYPMLNASACGLISMQNPTNSSLSDNRCTNTWRSICRISLK